MSKSRIAICLFDEAVNELMPENLISGDSLTVTNFTGIVDHEVLLYLKKSELSTPAWVEIVREFGELNYEELNTSSSGAILFIKVKERIIGCCFGTSVAYINRNNIETNFGLGVAFDKMLKNQTKTIESFTLAHNPLVNNRISSIPTSKNNFNIDSYLENITELSGYFYRGGTKTLVKGKEFYSLPSPNTIDDIINTAIEAIECYYRSIDNDDFKRLTSTRKVKSKDLIKVLDLEICKLIRAKSEDIFFIDYETINEIDVYRFTPKGTDYSELRIEDFYNSLQERREVNINFLKSRRITLVNSDYLVISAWSLYKCLFTEIKIGTENFILFKGKWYIIDENYLASLRKFISDFEVELDFLTPWNGSDSEEVFNNKLAEEFAGQCWDRKLYFTNLYSYGIEFCDVLTNDYIIHVKKYSGSQLTSHLLMQTIVSAQLLNSDIGIRNWVKEKEIEFFEGESLILDENLSLLGNGKEYFVLLMSQRVGKLANILPFFSLITMHLTIKRITQLGFKVKIGKL